MRGGTTLSQARLRLDGPSVCLPNPSDVATVSTPTHHLLLRPVRGHPGVAVHLVLSAADANLTLAWRQLERIEPPR